MHGSSSDGRLSAEALRRVDRPIAEASGLPNPAYTSDAHALFERDHLLARSWTCIAVGHDVPRPGDLRPVALLGLPLLLLRDRAGAVRVFHNVCSHRGVQLVSEPGSAGPVIRCPYHSWSYDLDGRLRATPHIGGPGLNECDGFDRSKHGLVEVRTAVWFDVVFVNLSGDAPDFAEHVAPLSERWRVFDPALLRHGGEDSTLHFDVRCNWKLAVENYCEAYHLPWVHPSLNSYSRLEDHYAIVEEGAFAGQGSLVYNPTLSGDGAVLPRFPGLPPVWDHAAEYAALFPNVLLGIHSDHFFAVQLEPLGAGLTREHLHIYYVGDEPLGRAHAALRAANREAWRTVFAEDVGVVEAMQRGRASPAFRGGAFSPAMDVPTHCFHKWVARRLLAAS